MHVGHLRGNKYLKKHLKGALNPKFMLTSKCRQICAIKKSEFIICITCSVLKIFPVEAVIKASLRDAMFFAALTSEYVVGSDLDHVEYSLIGTNMPYCIAFGCDNSTDRLCQALASIVFQSVILLA